MQNVGAMEFGLHNKNLECFELENVPRKENTAILLCVYLLYTFRNQVWFKKNR